jgi:hypothetical protein
MSTAGLNPAGTLCLGAINTIEVLIGNAIKINNTTATAEITIDGETYSGTGTPTVFPNIISRAGLNPTGTLHIGTSNTSEIDMGLLKIDNTVVPPQIYINGISVPPGSLTNTSDKFILENNVIQDNSDINLSPLSKTLRFINVNNSTIVTVGSIPDGQGNGQNNVLVIAQQGLYEFNVKFNINNSEIQSPTTIICLRGAPGTFTYADGSIPTISGDIPDSEIEFIFNGGTSTLSNSRQFLVYASSSNSSFTIISYIDPIQLNKIGTEISIKRIGEWPPPVED